MQLNEATIAKVLAVITDIPELNKDSEAYAREMLDIMPNEPLNLEGRQEKYYWDLYASHSIHLILQAVARL